MFLVSDEDVNNLRNSMIILGHEPSSNIIHATEYKIQIECDSCKMCGDLVNSYEGVNMFQGAALMNKCRSRH